MADIVWLARHGNREDFVDPDWRKTAERPHDPALSSDGVRQARQLGRRLQSEGIAHIFSSPFLRCVQTAHEVAAALDLDICLETGISEWMNPEWFPHSPETLPAEQLAKTYPRITSSYTSKAHPEYPETEEEAMQRAGATAHTLAKAYDAPILIVGHGVSVAGAVGGLVQGTTISTCALCSIFKIVRDERSWRMEVEGDISHLEEAAASDRFH